MQVNKPGETPSTLPVKSHPALKVSAATSLVMVGIAQLDLLPYFGICSDHYNVGLAATLVLLTFALVVTGVWVAFDLWRKVIRAPGRNSVVGSLVAVLALLLGFATAVRLGAHTRRAAVEGIVTELAPTVQAVHDYTSRHKRPPRALSGATPPPSLRVCATEGLVYSVSDADWSLSLTLHESPTARELLVYRSTGKLEYGESSVGDWAWLTYAD